MTKEKIDEAAAIYEAHLGPGLFNYDGNVCRLTHMHMTGHLDSRA